MENWGESGMKMTMLIGCFFMMIVQSAQVDLEDDKHASVKAEGHSEVVMHPAGKQQQPSFTFSTTGRKP